jgi:hypothetical protein
VIPVKAPYAPFTPGSAPIKGHAWTACGPRHHPRGPRQRPSRIPGDHLSRSAPSSRGLCGRARLARKGRDRDTDQLDRPVVDQLAGKTYDMVREYTEARDIARAHDAHGRLSPGDRI